MYTASLEKKNAEYLIIQLFLFCHPILVLSSISTTVSVMETFSTLRVRNK